MYRKIAAVLFPVSLIALVATGVWGYYESKDKDSVLIKAENQYQRAFHELNDHMDQLNEEMGKSLAINSAKQTTTSMTNVWRLTYAAQNDIAQLPMTLMPFHKAEEFLSDLGTFSYKIGVRDLHVQPMSNNEWKSLHALYNHQKEIRSNLHQLQSKVMNKNLRWMDVELALASEDNPMDNTIIDGFHKVNKMVEQYPEADWGPTVNNLKVRQKEKYTRLKGNPITAAEAKRKVAQLMNRPSTKNMSVVLNKKGDYQTYSVRYPLKSGDVYTDVTKIGGHVVWMIDERPVGKAKLNFDQAEAGAKRFLTRIGFPDMSVISYNQADNLLSLNYVHRENGVLVYPQALTVKVALDNGNVVGIQAAEYVFNFHEKAKGKPKLTEAGARKYVSPRLKIQKTNLASIYGEDGNEALCYEFLGTIDKDQFRVFINAKNGNEELVEKITKADISKA
ncbi:germination protein YpeB [Shimazuella sp. AN120528]|uniref:germination protein YpeB n=1 Tax=Shimazuella soli TaxID=1892854 RepID=UPI001F0E8F60|nr:germination protein YpeB [Shimazuella soli]MCH5584314.1 germination protein YpeB [Shimazuella soli]